MLMELFRTLYANLKARRGEIRTWPEGTYRAHLDAWAARDPTVTSPPHKVVRPIDLGSFTPAERYRINKEQNEH